MKVNLSILGEPCHSIMLKLKSISLQIRVLLLKIHSAQKHGHIDQAIQDELTTFQIQNKRKSFQDSMLRAMLLSLM